MSDVTVGLLFPPDPAILDIFRSALPSDWAVVVGAEGVDAPDFAEALPRLDYIVAYGSKIAGRHIERATRLSMIQKVGVGTDDLDVAACRERGIRIATCPTGSTEAVAEQALALMLAALKRLVELDRSVRRDHEWDRWRFRPLIRQLTGSTVGIVGYGAIGQAVASRLVAFGASVLVHARREIATTPGVTQCRDLNRLFDTASIISLHVPLTAETRGLVTEDLLARLGPHGILVNTARGGVVDEPALLRVLSDGRLGFAALDVLAAEPPPVNHPLLSLDHVLVTPHVGGGGFDVLRLKAAFIADNLRAHAGGAPIMASLT